MIGFLFWVLPFAIYGVIAGLVWIGVEGLHESEDWPYDRDYCGNEEVSKGLAAIFWPILGIPIYIASAAKLRRQVAYRVAKEEAEAEQARKKQEDELLKKEGIRTKPPV